MKTREQLLARIAREEQKMQDTEAEIKQKRGSPKYDADYIQDLNRYVNGCQQNIYVLEWVLGEREE
jgi:hypothetical protein